MSSKRAKASSIAVRLVSVFTVAAVLLTAAGLGVFYWLVVRHAFAEDNAALLDKVSALSADVVQFGTTQSIESEITAVHHGEQRAYWVRLLDRDGRILAEAPGMGRLLPQNIFPPPSADARPLDYHTPSQLFSLISIINQANGQQYVLQVAQDRSTDEKFNREVGLLFLVMLVLSVVASVYIARLASKRGLQPITEMTAAVQRIGPTRLGERVAPLGWPRELQPLAGAFDQMLGRLEDSFTRLSQFSADLAHELRTPIANILGEAQVALSRDRSGQEYREVIESTVTECERLSRMADSLLFLARAESAREQIQLSEFDAGEAAEQIASFYRTIAEDRGITIACRGHGNIVADKVLFTRAVNNLVDNAMRFTPDGGTIRISISPNTDTITIAVIDTGCGIASKHLPRLFDRFYTADPSRSSAGAGLGLALVKSIAELHGGSAAVQSEIDRGTTVTLKFPVSASILSNNADSAAHPIPEGLTRSCHD